MAAPSLEELMRLPVEERVRLVDDLWESILRDVDGGPIPDSHREGLARRRNAYQQDPGRVRPWEEVRDRLWSEE